MKKMQYVTFPIILAFVATLIGALAAILSGVSQNKGEEEIKELNAKLVESQNEILRLNGEINQAITGGDGYCYVMIDSLEKDEAVMSVISTSKFPLYDIGIDIRQWLPMDQLILDQRKRELYTKYKGDYNIKKYIEFRFLRAMNGQLLTSKDLGTMPYFRSERVIFSMNFDARNGEWSELWEIYTGKKGKPMNSYIVYKTIIENHKMKRVILKKYVNPGTPDSVIEALGLEYDLI